MKCCYITPRLKLWPSRRDVRYVMLTFRVGAFFSSYFHNLQNWPEKKKGKHHCEKQCAQCKRRQNRTWAFKLGNILSQCFIYMNNRIDGIFTNYPQIFRKFTYTLDIFKFHYIPLNLYIYISFQLVLNLNPSYTPIQKVNGQS